MSLDFESLYSENALNLKKSVIRELLKLTNKPEIISFAGGLPSPETFPVDDIRDTVGTVLDKHYKRALQYGSTEGDVGLRQELIKFITERGVTWYNFHNVLVTTASQQALDLIAKVFIDPGDSIICSLPSYVGGLGAFTAHRANMVGIPLKEDGMDTEMLETELKKLAAEGKKAKFIYIIPDFQNPAGVCFSLACRKRILELAKEYGTLVIEDSPYRELRYNGEPIPSLLQLDKGEGYVATLFTFSKIFIPGFRLGWIVGNRDLVGKFVIAKQSMDLCTPPFTQHIAREYLLKGNIRDRIQKNIALYKPKKDLMLECLEKEMPEGVHWTKPEGGLFLFVYLPEGVSADEMFHDAINENVAYVIGSAFHCNGKGQNTFRLNFSYPSHMDIREGIRRLANCVKKKIAQAGSGSAGA